MGSPESVALVNSSAIIRRNVNSGRLNLTYIPENMTTAGQEEISMFLTDLWVNQFLLRPAEWLLVYQLDSKFDTTIQFQQQPLTNMSQQVHSAPRLPAR